VRRSVVAAAARRGELLPTPLEAGLSPGALADDGLEAADRMIEELLPTLDREDLESAGRGLQSIYRGLQGLLRSAGTAEDAPETGN
jgi:hypothetical protein